jgi:hypothetical protein
VVEGGARTLGGPLLMVDRVSRDDVVGGAMSASQGR